MFLKAEISPIHWEFHDFMCYTNGNQGKYYVALNLKWMSNVENVI